MSDYLNENKMFAEARAQGKVYSPMKSILIYFIIIVIINFITQMLLTPAMVFLVFGDSQIMELISSQSADYSALMQRMYDIMANPPEWINIYSLFLRVIMLAAPIIYCKSVEKRSAASMGFRKNHIFSEYLKGLFIGIAMMIVVVLMSVAGGCVTYDGVEKFSIPVVILYFIGYMLQGMAEETLIHGYFMVSSAKNTTLVYSLMMSSLLFTLAHTANIGMTFLSCINIFLFALFAGIYVMRRGNIWGIGAIHASWNFTQGILFGFNVSGNTSNTSILKFTQAEGRDILNGGAFGPEGGLFVTLVLFLAVGAVLVSRPNKNEVVSADNSRDAVSE